MEDTTTLEVTAVVVPDDTLVVLSDALGLAEMLLLPVALIVWEEEETPEVSDLLLEGVPDGATIGTDVEDVTVADEMEVEETELLV